MINCKDEFFKKVIIYQINHLAQIKITLIKHDHLKHDQIKKVLLLQSFTKNLQNDHQNSHDFFKHHPHISISHTTQTLCIVEITDVLNVSNINNLFIGVDLEIKNRIHSKLINKISNNQEQKLTHPYESCLWTIKEASFKALSKMNNKLKITDKTLVMTDIVVSQHEGYGNHSLLKKVYNDFELKTLSKANVQFKDQLLKDQLKFETHVINFELNFHSSIDDIQNVSPNHQTEILSLCLIQVVSK